MSPPAEPKASSGSAVYRGRFAPSPTGPLHLGSLLAAVASYADARAQDGVWLLRIEDLDRPRLVSGAAVSIQRTLSTFGLEWDEPVLWQSTRLDAYDAALGQLQAQGLVYGCACSRTEIAAHAVHGIEGPIYPGTCRQGPPPGRQARSLRLMTNAEPILFQDRIQGHQGHAVSEAVGDFVVRRADGIHAYQLAVVVDDADQGITHVVRGADLLLSTPRQILLQRYLRLPTPIYAHVPLVLDEAGRKLSKSLAALPLDPNDPLPALHLVWRLLGQTPLSGAGSVRAFWREASAAWRIERVPRRLGLPTGACLPVKTY
ncbi:tRNA glutamyl-Q(34) synthetase GluQRS [Caldichromatium japonicum]|uniref:Glutamyl-Q tRNA(Asp) synthetase n=1 Tax=Caldichromatium japonicum TaxID=2699430 RepID=A0A6G7VEN2_9GAMM|nr:tRNA glutamyl-Q(34) synthetase GluQRS [Caldichromatium japonicum]QIK38499.1 tRNA glutamyl-Q(34) synthetase GluQRS [Caldichromatium japonicum]